MKLRQLLILLFSTFLLQSVNAQVVKNVVIEKYTSARCGNCPRGTELLKDLVKDKDNIIWLSHHVDWIPDQMQLDELSPMYDDFAGSAPRASFDRVHFDGENLVAVRPNMWAERLETQLDESAYVDVAVHGGIVERDLYINLEATFDTLPDADDIRVTVFVVEDVVVGSGNGYDQRNYDNNNQNSLLYDKGDPILNYEHLNVTRAVITDLWGTAGIIPDSPEIGVPYMHQFTYTVPEEFDMTQLRVVALLNYYDDNVNNRSILNAGQEYVNNFLSVGIDGLDISTFTTFPNPFLEQTFIEIENLSDDAQLKVYNMNGQVVSVDYMIGSQGITVKRNNVPAGTYLFQIIEANGTVMGKGKWMIK